MSVFYCLLPDRRQQGIGFGIEFEWDVPLLLGYDYKLLHNVAARPSVSTFLGCDTPGIGEVVRTGSFDAFIVNGWRTKSCLQALWACRRHGVPCIVRGESNHLRTRSWPIRVAHRLLLNQYSACITIGKSNAAFYRANGVPEARLFAGPYCVDNQWFASRASELERVRAELRTRWRIPHSAYVFLFCGKFVDKKRPADVIEALAIARTALGPPMHLLMVGDGELRSRCELIVRERALPVSFSGFLNQQQIVQAYVAADCLVLPSDFGETWGLVVNESMACGRPAIVSDRVGCHPDLIESGVTGGVFPFGSSRALASVLLDLASHPQRSGAMGQRARERVAQYSVESLVSGTIAAAHAVRRVR